MYPTILRKIIEDFQKLPGIGEKSAERLALHLVTQLDNDDIIQFSDHLKRLKAEITYCPVCHMITDQPICSICKDETRDHKTLMVVADAKDVFQIEKMKTYHGVYHVLGGLIDFSRGVTDKDLHIDTLAKRIPHVDEVIVATNSTVEGEMTAKYLKALFNEDHIVMTRLAYGLPVGTDLKYADELTLSKAVENRQKF